MMEYLYTKYVKQCKRKKIKRRRNMKIEKEQKDSETCTLNPLVERPSRKHSKRAATHRKEKCVYKNICIDLKRKKREREGKKIFCRADIVAPCALLAILASGNGI